MERITEERALELYDEMLDECLSSWSFGSCEYMPSDLIKSVDPIAYRCDFNDYCDAQGWELYEWNTILHKRLGR